MEINILVIGLKAYNDRELNELFSLLNEEYRLKKLPSSEEYLLCCVPDNETTEITEELTEISKKHNNPAWEIITRKINSQLELEGLPIILYYESR